MRRRIIPFGAAPRSGDSRSARLVEAARELLAGQDYEAFSIAGLVRRAGCSIGAFYGRYPDKHQFLYTVITLTFHDAEKRAGAAFDSLSKGGLSADALSQRVVQTIVNEMSDPATAGVTRAALKLSATMPEAATPLLNYRKLVSDRAAAFAKAGKAKIRMREAVQIAFAAVIDAIIQNPGPLKPGGEAMRRALATMMANHLGGKG